MRKFFLCLLMSLIGMFCSVEAQTIVFHDGFESGNLDKWTQEAVVGNTAWDVESIDDNLAFPSNVIQGTHRAYLRNNTGETQGYVTRLISPVMKLDTVYQPMLMFWYANPKWTADRDTLRVLYKNGPKANWKEIAVYADAQKDWTKVAISLPEYSEAYQIAFEGKDNLGRGIVLDSVVVRSAPECTVPRDFSFTSGSAGKATIAWQASWDANEFDVIITKESIEPDTIESVDPSVIVVQTKVDGMQHYYDATLKSGAKFFMYVRSVCEAEISDWSKEYAFRMTATKYMPYFYDFNLDYTPGFLDRDEEWSWGGNTGKYNPFISTHLNSTDLALYSPDATPCVMFTGANTATTALPAGKYAYTATPALADSTVAEFKIQNYQVRFWSTIAAYTGRAYAHSLIVGVMTQPEDITTFVPVDTVSVWGTKTFQENLVSFENYKGDGTYVAFLSNFEKQNLFYIDNMTIERRQEINKVTKIYVNPRDTFAMISWEGNPTAKYNVLIADVDKDADKIAAANIIDQAVVTGTEYTCTKLEAFHSWNRPYYVYVQAIVGDTVTEWSYRYPFVTIASKEEMPMTFDMEQDAGTYYMNGNASVFYPGRINIFTNDPEYPHLYTTHPYKGASCLNLTKDWGNDSWITFPMIENLKDQQMTFYVSGNTTGDQVRATVGVMSNPMDINTFTPLSDFTVTKNGYVRCYANFADYQGNDSIVAIVWTDLDNGKKTINYIDDVVFEEIGKCLPVTNLTMTPGVDTVTVSWNKNTSTQFEFVFSKIALAEEQLEDLEALRGNKNVIFADTVSWSETEGNPTFGFGGLNFNTPFYAYVCTLCGAERAWWAEASTKTLCPEDFPIPFFDDFESYAVSGTDAGCWTLRDYAGTGYPKILAPSSGAQSGNMLELWSTSTSHRTIAALPGLDGDLSHMLLSFDARSLGTTTATVVYVGTMSDFDDPETFVGLDTIYMDGGNEFTKVRIDFENYTLPNNNIVITSGLGETLEKNSDIYIDNVSVKPNNCIDVYDIEVTDVQQDAIDWTWKGKTAEGNWEVKVLSKYAELKNNKIAPYDTAKVAIVNDSIITGKAFHVEGLTPLTPYYFYVRALCGDSLWAVDSVKTACIKLDPTKPNKETFEDYKSGSGNVPDCWTVGNGYGPSAGTANIPYVYSGSTYASSGTMVLRINESTAQSPAYAASPEIAIDNLTDLAVSFTFYASTSYYGVWGVMSDPTDLSTFVALDSLKGTAAKVFITLDLSDYADLIPASAKYFAWRGRYGAADLFYLDDVSIIKLNCPLPKPSYSGLTAEQVRISGGIRTDNDWALLVTTKFVDPDSLAKEGYIVPDSIIVFNDTIEARSKVVTGLNEQTDYYVAVATVCEEGSSQWQTLNFKTPCKAITPEALGTITFSKRDGYVSGSSASRYMPCWTVGNKSGNASATSTYIPYVNTTSSYLFGPQKDSILYIYAYVPTSATSTAYDGAYAIMPELDVDDISKYQVNFYARTTSSTGATYHDELIVGVVTDPSDLNTFVAVDTVKLSHTAYEAFTISFEDYQGDYLGNKGRYIMFLGECGTPTYFYAYIASISVNKIPTCRTVTAFNVDSVAEDAAMISWKQYSDSYRLMVANEIVADDEKDTYDKWLIDSLVSKTDSVLISGLAPSTQYYAYAQAMCEGGDSSAISMTYAFFTTLCPENGFTVPYKQDFEKYATNAKVVDCWQFEDYLASTKTYPEVMNPTSGAVSGKQLELWSTSAHNCVAIMPKIQGNLADYMLSFDARSYGVSAKSVLYIGTMDDVLDSAAGFAPFDTLYMDGGNEFYHKDLVLADYADKLIHSRIAFTSGLGTTLEMTSDMYLDNVKIGMPPSCFAPTLEAGNSSMNSATIKITPAKATNTKWHLAVIADSIYTAKGFDLEAYLDTTPSAIYTAEALEYEITGLQPGTVYQVFGRTVCGGEDGNSDWTNFPTKTRTKYYFKDSYYFGFEKSEGWEFCQGSTSTTYWVNPAIEIGYSGGSATTSYTSYYPYCMANTTSSVYAYGPREASDPKNAALRWQASSSYWGGYAIFPAVAEAHDRSFEFKMRCGYGSYVSAKDTMNISTNYACDVEIGTIDKDKGFETYEVIATVSKEALPKVRLTEANDWLWTRITMDLDSATVADKQIVIRLPKPLDSNTRYLHFDDVTLGASKGFGMVSINKIIAGPDSATVIWDKVGGPWNLYITQYDATTKKTDTVASFENISGKTSQVIKGLTPQSTYTAILVATNAPAGTKYKVDAIKKFKTPCLAIEPDAKGEFTWDFNDPSEWERSDVLVGNNTVTDSAYWKPSCFTVGTTYASAQTTSTVYYNWLIQRKGYSYTSAPTTKGTTATSTARYEYGRFDSPALRVYTGSATYMTPYLVLPELNCGLDTMMIEFWARCLCNYAADYGTPASQNKMVSASYCGGSYSQSLVIGTLTDPHDFSTLQVIDTLTYTAYTSTTADLVTKDPTGNRYWQKMQLPLGEAKGKYIVLFQAGYGLFFVDDMAVKPVGDNIFAPSHPKTGAVTSTTADFSWQVKHPSFPSVVVVTNQTGDQEIIRDTLVGTEYTATSLQPGTAYQWYMYQTNPAGTKNSSETERIDFNTECVAVTPEYANAFELEDGWRVVPGRTDLTNKQTQCWVYGNAGTSATWSTSYSPYNRASSGTVSYNHTKDGAFGLWMAAYGTTYQPYIAMPAIDIAALDTLQINFWMRPGYHNPGTGKISTQYTYGTTASTAEYYYSKAIIVGTMTDPNDPTTFVPIDTVNYEGTFTTSSDANEANDYLFQLKKVSLAGATGRYVAFMTTLYAKGETRKSTYGYIGLDDIYFSPIQSCKDPFSLEVSNIATDSAVLSWEAGELSKKFYVEVSTDVAFEDPAQTVFTDTVDAKSCVVKGLKSYTNYVWHVKSLCGEEGESEFSVNGSFTTLRSPFYQEDFRFATLDEEWSFGTNNALLVLDSTDVEITGSNSTSYGFKRITNSYGLYGAHYCVPFYSSSTTSTTTYDNYWMISPVIHLDEAEKSHMTLNLALTHCTSGYTPTADAATEADMADDFLFLIVISEDGGKTWKKNNILGIWNNTYPAGYQLRDIPNTPTAKRYDLTKYAGKDVRIAFYRYAETYKSAGCAMHIGNIRVANYTGVALEREACQFEDIEELDYNFYVDGDKVTPGKHIYQSLKVPSEADAIAGARDTLNTLTAIYKEAVTTIIEDTICEGESYSSHDFSGKTTAGLYKRKLQGVNSCDSIVYLYLHVNPRQYTNLEAKICQGEKYDFNGKILDRTGVYYDTVSCVATGCDSVLILSLQVMQPAKSEFSATACETTGYYWEAVAKTYTESGDFTEVLKTVDGCDSTVTLHLTIAKLYQDTKEAQINEGESYTFYGNEYDKSGTYEVVIEGQGGECDSTHVLVLTVLTALDNVENGNLTLMPNIIRAGQSVTAKGNFSGNVHVEVYDIVGRMILNENMPANRNRIEISAFDNAGVYTVRISDKLNTQFVGRVIVQ